MIVMLLLFSFNVFAEDISTERYCFSSSQVENAKQKLKGVLVPSDEVTADGNCLTIKMKSHRRELIQKFLMTTVPGTQVTFSSEDLASEPCLLKVEKVKQQIENKREVGLDQSLVASETVSELQGTETLQLQTLKDFELTVDQDQVKGECRLVRKDNYSIKIEVRKNPRPFVPPGLPPGTIVVLNHPPADQETMVLQTHLILTRGQKIELGSIIKNLKNKDHSIDVKPDVIINTTNQQASEKVFLSIQ